MDECHYGICIPKDLNLSGVDFGNNAMVAFIIQMIRGAPRLQMLETIVSGMQYVLCFTST